MKIGRNDPCPCGSGRKYKNCCLEDQGSGLPDEGPVARRLLGKPASSRARSGLPRTAPPPRFEFFATVSTR
ncbi:MAG: SEC-C metal-binding domain-containing protein [Desulfobacteria bacterium]|nr:SEC-C metal-binding domain-containing protein [Deltaproteobacteria bacterium]